MQHPEMVGHTRIIAGHRHYLLKAKIIVVGPPENKYHMDKIPAQLSDIRYFSARIGNTDHRFTGMYGYRRYFLKLIDKMVKKRKRIVLLPA